MAEMRARRLRSTQLRAGRCIIVLLYRTNHASPPTSDRDFRGPLEAADSPGLQITQHPE